MGLFPTHLPSLLFLLLSLLLLAQPCASGPGQQPQSSGNTTRPSNRTCSGKSVCKPGVLLPVWMPVKPPFGERLGRAIVYFLSLVYMFLGVSIVADRFMASIEVITSQEREVTITTPNGETTVKKVRIWNETVANLTLMALGSSAPEILLAVIEVCGHNFDAGELGPGTIVGSAAFNMFVIIGLCVGVITDGESRKIKHLGVFFMTDFWSIFAYIWLYLILAVISPGIVQVWEAVITLLYFPVCVIMAWFVDRRLFYKCMRKRVGVCMCPVNSSNMIISVQTCNELDHNKDETDHIEHFFVRLQNLRLEEGENRGTGRPPKDRLMELLLATNTNLKDYHAGIFTFGQSVLRVSEGTGTLTVTVVRNFSSRGTVVVPYHTEDGSAKAGVDYEETRGKLEFTNEQTSQVLKVRITNVEGYEKQENFFIVLEDPKWLKPGISGNRTSMVQEARLIAEMAKPILGEDSRLEVVIEVSSTVDKLLSLASVISTHSWREQFIEAFKVSTGDGDDEQRPPNCFNYFMHILSLFWKILFACIPPCKYWNGWACFVVSIFAIGVLTAIIGDIASHFGCTIGLRDAVTAVIFVALGTSVPDTFASKVAAIQDPYADASIGNVTGSNAVNVFLGIGMAWSVAAVYWEVKGDVFRVDPGSLAFSVTLFTIFASITTIVLVLRRRPSIGGELGGPRIPRVLTSLLFFGLWLLYVLFSSLEAYCIIRGF
ncbi:sodium/calcium exchanger 2-like [Symphorus nematophorus]